MSMELEMKLACDCQQCDTFSTDCAVHLRYCINGNALFSRDYLTKYYADPERNMFARMWHPTLGEVKLDPGVEILAADFFGGLSFDEYGYVASDCLKVLCPECAHGTCTLQFDEGD